MTPQTPTGGAVSALLLALCVGFFLAVQLVAVDFGDGHWDEPGNIGNLDYALEHGVPFPRSYIYPGGLTLVLIATALPELLTDGAEATRAFIGEKAFWLRTRAVLIVLCSGAVLATWLLSRALAARPGEAVFAAALVATSWALGAHARFIANDAMVATLSVLTLACAAEALRTQRSLWLWAAAVAGGFATGFKYTPVGLAAAVAWVAWQLAPPGRRLHTVIAAGAVFLLAFLFTTPGLLVEPSVVWTGVNFSRETYATGWNGYTVQGPLDVIAVLVGWLLFAALAKPVGASLVLALFAVVGLVALAREPRARPAFAFLVLFILVFVPQRAFIARNVLALIPVLAVAAARGVALASAHTPRALGRAGPWIAPAVAALVLVLSGVSVARAAWASAPAQAEGGRAALVAARAHVAAHPDVVFVASPQVQRLLGPAKNLVSSDDPRASSAPWILAMPHELFVAHEWPANDPFLVTDAFGPAEVDWRYLPSWIGRPRILLVSRPRALDAGAAPDFKPVARSAPSPLPLERIAR